MSKTELPYKAGTKGFLIAQRLLAGEGYSKIEEDMKVNRKSIWNVASQLRKKGFHVPASRDQQGSSQVPPLHQTTSQGEVIGEARKEVHGGSSSKNEVPADSLGNSRGTVTGSSKDDGATKAMVGAQESFYQAFGRELEMIATPILRKVVLNPKIPLYYDITREELKADLPQSYDFGDFICDCVEFFMRHGLKGELQWVKRREVA